VDVAPDAAAAAAAPVVQMEVAKAGDGGSGWSTGRVSWKGGKDPATSALVPRTAVDCQAAARAVAMVATVGRRAVAGLAREAALAVVD